MKVSLQSLAVLVFLIFIGVKDLHGQDQTISKGAYIINMGVTPQTTENALKPYGLVLKLVNDYKVPVIWSLKSGKAKDEADFTYDGYDFKGAPFIVPAEFLTPAVKDEIGIWEAKGVVGITTETEVTVPVFKIIDYTFKWTLDAANGSIAKGYIESADIPETYYDWTSPELLNCCNDIYVMPHADPEWSTHGNLFKWVKSFDEGGCVGSIWAACHAVSALENSFNPDNFSEQMNFLSNANIPIAQETEQPWAENSLILWGDHEGGTPSYSYAYSDHPIMQFLGVADDAMTNGSEDIYVPKAGWRTETLVGGFDSDHPDVTNGAAGVMVFGDAFGNPDNGKVFYEAGHNHGGSDEANIAAQRAFFNFSIWAAAKKSIENVVDIPSVMKGGLPYELKTTVQGDPSNFTYKWLTSCSGTFTSTDASTTTFTPDVVVETTTCAIQCLVVDLCGRESFTSITITVEPTPLPPVAANDTTLAFPNKLKILNVLENDYDLNLDSLTVSFISSENTDNGTFYNKEDGTISYVSNSNFLGLDSLQYQVCDTTSPEEGGPLCDTAWVFVKVDVMDQNGCVEDEFFHEPVHYAVSAEVVDADIVNVDNAKGAPDQLFMEIEKKEKPVVVDLGTNIPTGAVVRVYASLESIGSSNNLYVQGTETKDIPNNFTDYLAVTSDIITVLEYTLMNDARYLYLQTDSDDDVFIDAIEYIDTPVCISAVPLAFNDTSQIFRNSSVVLDVTENDIDPQSLPLSISIVKLAEHGKYSLYNGSLIYEPDLDFVGEDSIIYSICNDRMLCDTAKYLIDVVAGPCSEGEIPVVSEGGAIAVDIIDDNIVNPANGIGVFDQEYVDIEKKEKLLRFDLGYTISSGEAITIRAKMEQEGKDNILAIQGDLSVNIPSNFELEVPLSSSVFTDFTYIPSVDTRYVFIQTTDNDDDVHIDGIFYSVVRCTGAKVDAKEDVVTTTMGHLVKISVADNDVSIPVLPFNTLTVVSGATPENGSVIVDETGMRISYIPRANFYGVDSFKYSICNTSGMCDIATVIVNVEILDSDNDGVANIVDLDDDNDGVMDVVELCGAVGTYNCISNCTACDPFDDDDNDGVLNYRDSDFGTLNSHGVCTFLDTDGDGVINSLDLDSDNDGISDIIEAKGIDSNGDGRVDSGTTLLDLDSDGLYDVYDDTDSNGNTLNWIDGQVIGVDDFDNDGVINLLDLDSDNDAIPDLIEVGGIDTDGDGVVDVYIDTDGDGWSDLYDQFVEGATNHGVALIITNVQGDIIKGDGTSSYLDQDKDIYEDYLDLDSDNDGIPDLVESGGVNLEGDGMVNRFFNSWDTNNNGFADIYDPSISGIPVLKTTQDSNGDGRISTLEEKMIAVTPSVLTIDADEDRLPNHLDLDADNDGILDIIEVGATDSDNDGMVDGFSSNDSDNDGLIDLYDGDIGNNGQFESKKALLLAHRDDVGDIDSRLEYSSSTYRVDFDEDDVPNFIDVDSDNDGIYDNYEAQSTAGYIAPGILDSDGDGLLDAYDVGEGADRNGLDPYNHDLDANNGDSDPDYIDLDADADNIPDLQEAWDNIADGDSQIDNISSCDKLDGDGDGLVDCFDADDTDPTIIIWGINPANDNDGENRVLSGSLFTSNLDILLPDNIGASIDEPDYRDDIQTCGVSKVYYGIIESLEKYEYDSISNTHNNSINTNEVRATAYCLPQEPSGWYYYYNPLEPSQYLFAIKNSSSSPNQVPLWDLIDYIELKVDEKPANRYKIDENRAVLAMARDWNVVFKNKPDIGSTFDVKFYFDPNEMNTLRAAADSIANTFAGATTRTFQWFKKPGGLRDGDITTDGVSNMTDITFYDKDQISDTNYEHFDGEEGTSSVGNGRNYVEFKGLPSFSGGTALITIHSGVLPVDLVSFKGESSSRCTNHLTWEVESEDNFSHYEVEQSVDGYSFETIAKVERKGTLLGSKSYFYKHTNANTFNYYRLKMVDLDGSYEYSKMISVRTDCGGKAVVLYPNPISTKQNKLNLSFYSSVDNEEIEILDIMGHVVDRQHFVTRKNDINNIWIDISSYNTGNYIVRFKQSSLSARVMITD